MKMNKAVYLYFVMFFFSSFSLAETWDVGADQYFPPYVVNEGGTIKGIHVDVVKAVLNQLQVESVIKAYPWARVVNVTDNEQVDFSFPWVGKTERFVKYHMVGPLQDGRTVFAVAKNSKVKYDNLKDLEGFTIGVVRGYAYTKEFDEAAFLKKDDAAKDNVNILRKLAGGRVDIIVGDENVLSAEARKLGMSDKIRFLPKALKVVQRYAAFPLGNKTKAERFAKALKEIKENGEYGKIIERYRLK